MKQIPRKTLLLAALLALVLIGVVVSALTLPNDDAATIRTRVVLEMVATMGGWLQRVGLDPTTAAGSSALHWWPWSAWLVGLFVLAVWIARAHKTNAQQQSRSKRS